MDFITAHFELLLVIVAVVVFIIMASKTLKKAHKVDREGIETDGVVSRIGETFDPDNLSSTYTTYVEFHDEKGVLRESPMSIESEPTHSVGDKLRIKFIPGDYELVRPVK